MKVKFIILLFAIAGYFTSCYDDKSNTSIKVINPLVIDMGGAPTSMSAFLLDTLEIKPVVYKIGSDDADLSYKWEISGNDIMPFVMDSTMTLKSIVSVAPNSNPYTIVLTVTDNRTNLQNYEKFSLSVYSNLGKGLIVADTGWDQYGLESYHVPEFHRIIHAEIRRERQHHFKKCVFYT